MYIVHTPEASRIKDIETSQHGDGGEQKHTPLSMHLFPAPYKNVLVSTNYVD